MNSQGKETQENAPPKDPNNLDKILMGTPYNCMHFHERQKDEKKQEIKTRLADTFIFTCEYWNALQFQESAKNNFFINIPLAFIMHFLQLKGIYFGISIFLLYINIWLCLVSVCNLCVYYFLMSNLRKIYGNKTEITRYNPRYQGRGIREGGNEVCDGVPGTSEVYEISQDENVLNVGLMGDSDIPVTNLRIFSIPVVISHIYIICIFILNIISSTKSTVMGDQNRNRYLQQSGYNRSILFSFIPGVTQNNYTLSEISVVFSLLFISTLVLSYTENNYKIFSEGNGRISQLKYVLIRCACIIMCILVPGIFFMKDFLYNLRTAHICIYLFLCVFLCIFISMLVVIRLYEGFYAPGCRVTKSNYIRVVVNATLYGMSALLAGIPYFLEY
ncbi:hypothetical protein NEAUS06_2432 [Nematocida ausubeli]|nr:hypothetical protein NEAUS06_2390 [Nematocida ausubeli]KAI5138155.1 hypothetical protein NEAUS06_2432 [Nematocida ausubeli]